MPEFPWTPAPWAVDVDGVGAGITQVEPERDADGFLVRVETVLRADDFGQGDRDWTMSNRAADLALMALAPEMAEAILAVNSHDMRTLDAVYDLAEKLEAIIAAHPAR